MQDEKQFTYITFKCQAWFFKELLNVFYFWIKCNLPKRKSFGFSKKQTRFWNVVTEQQLQLLLPKLIKLLARLDLVLSCLKEYSFQWALYDIGLEAFILKETLISLSVALYSLALLYTLFNKHLGTGWKKRSITQ